MSREDPPSRVRLPAELRDEIKAKAAENRRSMNAEIVARLEDSLKATPKASNVRILTAAEAKAKRELLQAAQDFGARVEALEADVAALKIRLER